MLKSVGRKSAAWRRCPTYTSIHLCATILFFAVFHGFAADLGFTRHFSDGMVLQRGKPVNIRGFAPPAAKVTVIFAGQEKGSTANQDGVWRVSLDPMPARTKGTELSCRIDGGTERVVLKNVVVGDVVMVARQSSIDISLGRDAEGKKTASAHQKNPAYRAIAIKAIPSAKPLHDLHEKATDGWQEVTSESALTMTANAYYLGRDLAAAHDVPIGIIDVNLGYVFPVSWLSREELSKSQKRYGRTDIPGQLKRFDQAIATVAADGVVEITGKASLGMNFMNHALFPSGGYNGTLYPLKDLALKAVILQLGNDYPYMIYETLAESENPFDPDELNRAYVQTYDIRKVGFRMEPFTTPLIIREWRRVLGEKDLPFGLIVPPGSDLNTMGQHHREMREMQRLIAENTTNVGVIMPGTDHVRFSAQPKDEPLLAKRCLSWINGAVYEKEEVIATGPVFDRVECTFNEATVYFKDGTAEGLTAKGNALDYFEAAGIEGEYTPAKATIDGETIQLESDTVSRITRVRYNWNRRPNQQLVNAAGLPAIPFRSEKADYHWFVRNKESDLPVEYSTPANEWPESDVTLINGQLQKVGYMHFTGWIGPAGFLTGPFGPNMGVRKVKAGSPADGKLFEGDVIYSANGRMLGEKAWEVMAAAVTASETRAAGGKLVLGLRRDGKNMDVELKLDVKGSYSPTAPYDCPKTEKLVSDLEEWVVVHGAKAGFLNYDAVFMLATGNPELQGYVRRIVYNIIKGKDPERPINPRKAGKSWHNSAEAFLLGEYYLATGDRNVLPHLKHACDRLAATQNPLGGWRHNYPGGDSYGLIPNAGLPGVMGMYFATEAGLDIDHQSYELGVRHFKKNRAETGFLIYGIGPLCEREVPPTFVPEVMNAGKMHSYNGGISAAGILMRFTDNYRAAHLDSLISSYAWNQTYGGHGGSFWGNFWTPLGAHEHGRAAFINFWKHHRWFRECNRMYDGGLIQNEQGGVGAGCGVALVAPRERIQILGAPTSPFSVNAPPALAPAVKAYWEKDYGKCEKLAAALIAGGTFGKDELPTAEYLLRTAQDMQASIDDDLTRMKKLCEEGDPDEARSFVAALKGVLPEGDTRLAEVEKLIASTKPAADFKAPAKDKAARQQEPPRKWVRLVTERLDPKGRVKGKSPAITSHPEKANAWRITVLENLSNAPAAWMQPQFDDSGWKETTLPVSWRMYHTVLLRTSFQVEDKDAFDALRLYAWVFRQQGIEIYLNGELIGKINNLEKKTGDIVEEFKESALKHLRNGENTLAITTRHNWRWGMLFMKVYNDGFDFNLDARLKD